ncbi:hypothetical protein TWF694_005050 [Orbilia ellipsospora]|uniref:Uncharacterized protein n=1 Tax=Orbilia ellipsospora TaxID=2528407 RepID=A0AAV9WUH5_9PEZI
MRLCNLLLAGKLWLLHSITPVLSGGTLVCDVTSDFTSTLDNCKTFYGPSSFTASVPTVVPVTTTTRTFHTSIYITSTVYVTQPTPIKTVVVKETTVSYSTITKSTTLKTTRTDPWKTVTITAGTVTSVSVSVETDVTTETVQSTDIETTDITSFETDLTTVTQDTTLLETIDPTTVTSATTTTTLIVDTVTIWQTETQTITQTKTDSVTDHLTNTVVVTQTNTVTQYTPSPSTLISVITTRKTVASVAPNKKRDLKRRATSYATLVTCTEKRGASITCSQTDYTTSKITPATSTVYQTSYVADVVKTTLTIYLDTTTLVKHSDTSTVELTETVGGVSQSTLFQTVYTTSVVTSSSTVYVYQTTTETITETATAHVTVQPTVTEQTTVTVINESTFTTSPTTTETDTKSTTITNTISETDTISITTITTAVTTVPSLTLTTLTSTQTVTVAVPTNYHLYCIVPGQGTVNLYLTIDVNQQCQNAGTSFVQQGYGFLAVSVSGTVYDPDNNSNPYSISSIPVGSFVNNNNCYYLQSWNYIQWVDSSNGMGFYGNNEPWQINYAGGSYFYLYKNNGKPVAGGGICGSMPVIPSVAPSMWILPCNIPGWGEGIVNFRLITSGASCGTGGVLLTAFTAVLRTASFTGAPDYIFDNLGGVNTFLSNDNCFYPNGNGAGGVFDTFGFAWTEVYDHYRIYSYDGVNVAVNSTTQSGNYNYQGTCSSPIVVG